MPMLGRCLLPLLLVVLQLGRLHANNPFATTLKVVHTSSILTTNIEISKDEVDLMPAMTECDLCEPLSKLGGSFEALL